MIDVETTRLNDVLLIRPKIFEDHRGSNVEIPHHEFMEAPLRGGIIAHVEFVEANVETSSRHVLRGIHGDEESWKLATCLCGEVYCVVVNNHPGSIQYRKWQAFRLCGTNHLQILIPPRFGVGYVVLSDHAVWHYKQSTYYDRSKQFTLLWNDPELGIRWPVKDPILSMRDEGLE